MKRVELFQSLAVHRYRRFQGVATPCSARDAKIFEKFLALALTLLLFLTACCPPATNSSTSQETAFKATFLGFSEDQHYLIAQPEGSSTNVQIVYEPALTLAIGQRIYVVGRLENNLVYVSDIRPL
jgi:hypothetical protein